MEMKTQLIKICGMQQKQWIIKLNIKHKTIKCLEENWGENLDDLGYGVDILPTYTTPKAQSKKEIIDKLASIKI